jgi:hypothetical protein
MNPEDTKPKESSMPEDWDKDAFPTSAKPVYRAALLLCLLVAALCLAVYASSEHQDKKEVKQERRDKIEDTFLADEQELAD